MDGKDSRVHAGNEWLRVGFQLSLWWQTSDDGLDEERTEAGPHQQSSDEICAQGFPAQRRTVFRTGCWKQDA
jgi:hypothetical protein